MHEDEVAKGERFRFGDNWKQFLELLDERRISNAERSLTEMLGAEHLRGKTFLDVGCGSGLFSLAALNLGAQVYSFDYDPASVWCAGQLKDRFHKGESSWSITQGSVLDAQFMSGLPDSFSVVYSWGVLHHTGHMYEAIAAAATKVTKGGVFYLAIYRKTWFCWAWKMEKKFYTASGPFAQRALRMIYAATIGLAHRVKNRGSVPSRGMDEERDIHDWLGGYPYESATPQEIKRFLSEKGFHLLRQSVKSEGMHLVPGCDEFVFQKT